MSSYDDEAEPADRAEAGVGATRIWRLLRPEPLPQIRQGRRLTGSTRLTGGSISTSHSRPLARRRMSRMRRSQRVWCNSSCSVGLILDEIGDRILNSTFLSASDDSCQREESKKPY